MAQADDPDLDGDVRSSLTQYNARVEEGIVLFGLQRLFWARGRGPQHVPVHRDNDLIAANFPCIETTVASPAFLWPETVAPGFVHGSETPTDGVVFYRFVQGIESRNVWARKHSASFQSEDGSEFSYVMLSTSPVPLGQYCHNSRKLRIWIQSGVHGNEPAGDQAVLALLGKMDEASSWTDHILAKVDILILPRYNPDGIADFNRPCRLGIDLNRDHIRLKASQTKHIRKMFCQFQPHIAVDMHEYSAKAKHAEKYIHGSDVMFSAAKNLNIDAKIRELSETLFATSISNGLQKANFRSETYIPTPGNVITFREAGSDGKIGRNAMGLTQCVSFLCETRGIGIADQHFHRRTAAGLKFLESVLEVAADNTDYIRSVIESSVETYVTSSNDVVVKDKATTLVKRTFTMIDTRTGQLLQLPIDLLSSTPTTPVLMRARPEAYIIPRHLAFVAQQLVDSGLAVELVEHEFDMVAEVLIIQTAVFDRTYYEGIVPMRVATKANSKRVKLVDGAFIVSTRQRNAALAFIALEPENIDSYVSINIIPVTLGGEYPVYRLLRIAKQ